MDVPTAGLLREQTESGMSRLRASIHGTI